jgi:hypothetical protein
VSNPGVFYLSSAYVKSYPSLRRFDIEDNIGESIHVHFDNIRADLTIKEFLDFAGLARDCLRQLYGDDKTLSAIPGLPGGFVKDFSRHIKNIREIRAEKISLGTLQCINVVDEKYGLSYISGLKSSRLFQRMKGRPQSAQQFLWHGVMRDILNKVITVENNQICLCGDSNVVRYGLFEALGLYLTLGGDAEVSVTRIIFDDAVDVTPPRCTAFRWLGGSWKRLKVSIKKKAFRWS